ncbi:MFS transporter [Paenibacillus tritici]|uniref:MFS transporter n=1 Tax=Paenibacillus tritici TaxID=1873425 RepID=A0ABX2DQQ2_9BACL|nr:MFS transporter [Paenibacillus tritici]NQX46965.1 MFS transporter [Paenibacillus tritici]
MKFLSLDTNVRIRLIERFFTQIVGNSIQPFMVIYFSLTLGAKFAGVLIAFNVMLAFIAGFYGGYLSDQFGRRKVMIVSELVRFVALLPMLLESTSLFDSAIVVYFAMTISSAAAGVSGPAGEALVIDSSNQEQRKYIYTLDYWLWNLSLLAGSLLGGFFFKENRMILLSFLSLMSLLSLCILIFLIKDRQNCMNSKSNIPKKRFGRQLLNNYRTVSTDSIFLLFLAASLLDLSVQTQTSNFIAVRLVHEVSEQTLFSLGNFSFVIDGYNLFGILNTLNAGIVILFTSIFSYFTKKMNSRYAIIAGMLLYTIGNSIISYETSSWVLLFMMAIVAIGELIYIPHKQALMADIIPDDKRGSYMALNAITTRGAVMLGSMAVTLGAIFSKYILSIEIFLVGLASCLLFSKLISAAHHAKGSRSNKTEANSVNL